MDTRPAGPDVAQARSRRSMCLHLGFFRRGQGWRYWNMGGGAAE